MSFDAVRGRIEAVPAERGFSGVRRLTMRGEERFSHATGYAHRGHRVPNVSSTRFAVASVTKMITAATALRLVDDGQLDLHRPLVELLPSEQQPRRLSLAVTTHHLLSHTSGVGDYFDEQIQSWEPWLALWDRIPTYHVRATMVGSAATGTAVPIPA